MASLRSTSCLASASAETDAENLCATELRLAPPGVVVGEDAPAKKPSSVGAKRTLESTGPSSCDENDTAAPAKAQVVGWPPVRAYRRNTFHQSSASSAAAKKSSDEQQQGGLYVKVSMDGAPYLRKVDLRMYKGYRELREALDLLFTKCFSASAPGTHTSEGCSDGQFAIAYEDKDGDLMLVGDVPWEMFTSSCKKLRIMKGSEAR
ncbi:hypothetical protein GUJ93_ZPchr0013g36291 [Zizania palustris]|uniref:Auxin-responsive protein n=1 Tax=Zizania palustris TaxID=103762 RepID=A0A8J5WZS6_ZIZPA|nr:hypothetical protein GUJ93_ZPchr0013g36291 [Zizania palustris]